MKYDKLVRDNIPKKIADSGKKAIFRAASESELKVYLRNKLTEEVAEYLESEKIDELVDIYEVLAALAGLHGRSLDQLDALATDKRFASGGFRNRIILLEVED